MLGESAFCHRHSRRLPCTPERPANPRRAGRFTINRVLVNRLAAAASALLLALSFLAPPEQARGQQAVPTSAAADSLSPEPPYSPRGAFFRSMILPGWGQAYVGAPGRGAVYFGLASGSFVMSYVARRQLLDARTEQEWLRASGAIGLDEDTEFVLARERHFEDWAALTIFLTFLAGADAYVSAYLSDFDERIGVVPDAEGNPRFQLTVPLGARP